MGDFDICKTFANDLKEKSTDEKWLQHYTMNHLNLNMTRNKDFFYHCYNIDVVVFVPL